MNKQELLNKINESAYQVKEVRNSLYHGKCYVVATNYINGIFKTKRGAEGYIKRNSGRSYYDEYLQELVYPSAGECFEILESEIIEVANNKMFWYKQLRKENYNIMCGLGENLIYEAKQSNVSEEIMEYIKESIKSLENNQGLTVYEEETKPVEIEAAPQEEIKEVLNDSETQAVNENNSLNIEVKFNEEKSGIELYFNEKPSEEIRSQLKLNGYRWAKFNKCWYVKDSAQARKFLQQLGLLNNEGQQENSIIDTTTLKEVEQTKQPEIIINEALAKRSKENMSFSDYKEGSATQEYNQVVAEISEKINQAKEEVKDDTDKQIKLDYLLNKFKKDYANWINKKNANGASHVSVMISGASNYNMNKHNKYIAREGKLWREYNDIMSIYSKIDKIIYSKKIIKSTDNNALEKLREKLQQEQKAHDEMVNYNKQARKEKKEVYPTYMLTNSNQRIKNIKDRISQLEKLEELKQTQGNTEIEINGIKIIDNLEANRLQMVFPDKPNENIRKILKSNGFRWCGTYGAWQRNRGRLSADKAKSIAESLNTDNVAV